MQIFTPESAVFDGEAQRLTIRTETGDLTILPGHIPYSAAVREGKGILITENGETSFFCKEGVLHVNKELVRLMVCELKKFENNQP